MIFKEAWGKNWQLLYSNKHIILLNSCEKVTQNASMHGSASGDDLQLVRIATLCNYHSKSCGNSFYYLALHLGVSHTNRTPAMWSQMQSFLKQWHFICYLEPFPGLILCRAAMCNIQLRQDVKWSFISEAFLLYLVSPTFPSTQTLQK